MLDKQNYNKSTQGFWGLSGIACNRANRGKRVAFTLAEVLITLGIIGVVAAITIPTLMNNIQEQQFKVAWKKSYSVLSSATQQLIQDSGGDLVGVFDWNSATTQLNTIYSKYLNTTKLGGYSTTNPVCWSVTTKALGGFADLPLTGGMCMALSDGSFIGFSTNYASDCNHGKSSHPAGFCQAVHVDVNGFKPPNIFGKDIFTMAIEKNKLVPAGTTGDDDTWTTCDNTKAYPNYGMGCSAKYLYGD